MRRFCCTPWFLWSFVWTVAVLVPATLLAGDSPRKKTLPKGEVVQIFPAAEKGVIDVELIAKGSAKCRLIVTNKTDRPLNVQLPEAFAGVPVLGQQGIMGNDFMQNNNAPQQLGVGPGGNRNNFMNPGMMNVQGPNQGGPNLGRGLLFNLPPEKVCRLRLQSVCLEHGKPDPKPLIKYQIKPIDEVTDKPEVVEVCAMLGRGEIPQRIAQLAAWHLANDMTWKQLGQIRPAFITKPTYSQKELAAAKKVVEKVAELVEKRSKPDDSTGD
ncbi:MAG: hypothetical protein HQ567_17365 [Candidatus Nealsonbacteria bacterium]|nr:hypothetical protein [Candidatus Nealsonbacteria bacterium]